MWPAFDPEIKRALATVKTLAGLRCQTPIREWPLVVADDNILFVVREWSNGVITAYCTSTDDR